MQVSNNSNITVRPVQAADNAAPVTPAPALVGKAKAEGDSGSGWENVGGIAKKIMEDAAKVGGDIKKLPWWEKPRLPPSAPSPVGRWTSGSATIWTKQGEEYNTYGQDQYLYLQKSGDGSLVEAMSKKHTFISDTLKDGDFNRASGAPSRPSRSCKSRPARPSAPTEGHAPTCRSR